MRLKELISALDAYTLCPASSCECIFQEASVLGEHKAAGIPKDLDFKVASISCNSKSIIKDSIFVAIKGKREDGFSHIEEAVEAGARVIVVEGKRSRLHCASKATVIAVADTHQALGRLAAAYYHRPSSELKVIGITGTNGKTTITYLIEAILRKLNKHCGVIGTVNYRYKGIAVIAKNTTPGPVELQSVLRDMADAGIEYVAMEVSSHALDQQRTEGTSFDAAIFTNLTQDHLDYHRNFKNYFSAKAKLFQGLKACARAVINNDDAYGRRLKAMTSAEVVTYGIESESDVTARDIEMDVSGARFTAVGSGLKMKCVTRLIGRHNVYNLLAAIAWALKEKIPQEAIQSAIGQFESVPGRLQRIEGTGGLSVFVDYAHTEDALKNVLQSFRQLPHRRVITVFGCGGERDKTKRPKMGAVATELSNHAIITNDNPRSEDPERIIADIRKGIKKNNYQVIQDRFEAIKSALTMGQDGDIVLIAGKGHEDYQIFKDKTIHFDDRETVRSCLKSKS